MKYWNKTLKSMTEYVPGEQPDNLEKYIKLNTNENPFSPAPSVLKAIKKECNANLRRYPDATAYTLRKAFAELVNLAPENIFIGNGSDEIFTLIFRGFIDKTELAAFPYPSYSLYCTMAEANAIKYDKIELDKNFEINFDLFLKRNYNLIIICNPNNPTGQGIALSKIEKFLTKYKGLLVVDEAYVDFYNESAIALVKKYDNLIITRSFSKSYSLAGLRMGAAIAGKGIIDGFLKLKDSYNVDRLAIAGALAALKDRKSFKYNLEMIRSNKEYLEESLGNLDFTIVPSKANFLFIKHNKIAAKELYIKLKEKMILVRYFEGKIQSEYLRVTVGSMMEIKALLQGLKKIIG